MPFIEVIQHSEATGRLKEIYDQLVEKRGKLAEVHKIQSLNPESIMAHMELYMRIMFGRSPLHRSQREMIAVIVSIANNCAYCVRHHAQALDFFWKDENRIQRLINDFRTAGLTEAEELLCEMAWNLTEDPGYQSKQELLGKMKQAGWDDRAILDTTLVIAYFNFVNRIVLNLGVELEDDGGGGYRYA